MTPSCPETITNSVFFTAPSSGKNCLQSFPMHKPSSFISSITLVAFLQAQIASVWALPVDVPEQKPAPTLLYLGDDPYTQALLKLQYDGTTNSLEWQLINNGLVLTSQSHALPEATESVDSAVVYDGDQIIVAGRTSSQNWFIRALNSQGEFQWQRSGEGRVYDLAFSKDGQQVYAVGQSAHKPLFMSLDVVNGLVQFNTDHDNFPETDNGLVFRQLLVSGEKELIIAGIREADGELELIKWQGQDDAVSGETHWEAVPTFCRNCNRAGVKAIALKNDREHRRFFSLVSHDGMLYAELKDAATGENLSFEKLPVSGNWEQALSVNDAIALGQVTLNGKQLAVTNDGCRLEIRGLSSSQAKLDLCQYEKAGQRKLLHIPSASDNETMQSSAGENSGSSKSLLTTFAEIAGIAGAIGLITLITGSSCYFHGKYKKWKDKVIAAREREDQRRQEEGIFIRNAESHRPTFHIDTLLLPPSSITSQVPTHIGTGVGRAVTLTPTVSDIRQAGILPQTPIELLHQMLDSLTKYNLWDYETKQKNLSQWLARHRQLVNIRDEITGNTPLHYLADLHFGSFTELQKRPLQKNTLDITRILLSNGADVDIRSNLGFTPLELAVANNQADLFQLMMRSKVNFNLDEISVLLHLAMRAENPKIFDTLLEKGLLQDDPEQPYFREKYSLTRYEWIKKKGVSHRSLENENGQTLLHEAAHYRNEHAAQKLLEKFKDVNATDKNHNTPLHLAALYLGADIVEFLLERGASVNAVNAKGDTPMHLAVQQPKLSSPSTIKCLLRWKAKIDIENGDKKTPFDLACEAGNIGALQEFSDAQSPIQIHGETLTKMAREGYCHAIEFLFERHPSTLEHIDKKVETYTPLAWAIRNKHADVADILIRHGSIVSFYDLIFASDTGNAQLLEALFVIYIKTKENRDRMQFHMQSETTTVKDLKYTDIPLLRGSSKTRISLLHIVVVKESLSEFIKTLLPLCESVNYLTNPDELGYTPLTFAACVGNTGAITLLLNHEANININDIYVAINYKQHEAVAVMLQHKHGLRLDEENKMDLFAHALNMCEDQTEVITILLKNGFSPNTPLQGKLPVHFAVNAGFIKVLILLLRYKADPNIRNKDGQTPLLLAVHKGFTEAVSTLLEYGADPDLPNVLGGTPLSLAINKKNINIVIELLKKADSKKGNIRDVTPIHSASAMGFTEAVTALLEKGADPCAKTDEGNTALHGASGGAHIEVLTALLSRVDKDKLDIPNKKGQTPLHHAIGAGRIPSIIILLEHGANPNKPIANEQGFTPLHLAAYRGQAEAVAALLKHHADPNLTNKDGKTPYDLAKTKNHREVMRRLSEALETQHASDVDQTGIEMGPTASDDTEPQAEAESELEQHEKESSM